MRTTLIALPIVLSIALAPLPAQYETEECSPEGIMPRVETMDMSRSPASGPAYTVRPGPTRPRNTTVSLADLKAPKDARHVYEKGIKRMRQGKLEEAETLFKEALTIYPKYASAWVQLGRVHLRAYEYDLARGAYRRAIEADSENWRAWSGVAHIAARDQDWETMAESTEKALDLMPLAHARLYLQNAVANFNLGNLLAAEASANNAIDTERDPNAARGYQILGMVQARRGEFELAAKNLRRYLLAYPNAEDAGIVKDQLATIEQVQETIVAGR